jgi:nitrile hydratase accessory protein
MKHEDPPIFQAPWQASAFALALQLHERGLFTWPEWAEALSRRIAEAAADGAADQGERYYEHWLAALEDLVIAKGAGTSAGLQRYASAWDHAAHRTRHGQAIELNAGDFPNVGP